MNFGRKSKNSASRDTKPGEALSDLVRESLSDLEERVEAGRKRFETSLPNDGSREWEENTERFVINVQQPARSYSPPGGTKVPGRDVPPNVTKIIIALLATLGVGGAGGAWIMDAMRPDPPPMHAEPIDESEP